MLKKIALILSLLAVIIVSVVLPVKSLEQIWIIVVVFIGTQILVPLIALIFVVILLPTIKKNKEYLDQSGPTAFIFNLALEALCDYGRAKINISGLELLPEEPSLLVYNHRSRFDPIVKSVVLKNKKVVQISKPENFKIPIAGPYMRRNCYLAIDRENPREAMKTINKAASFIKRGYYVGVAPEGTRNKGEGLLPFKDGCLKVAYKAECPIVVCKLYNMEKISKNFPFFKTNVYFKILKVYKYEEYKDMKTVDLSQEIKDLMLADEQ